MLVFDFQFCHCQLNYQFSLIFFLTTAFWLLYQLQNWELKQEQCTQPPEQQLFPELYSIEWTLHLYGNNKRVKFFFTGWRMLCNERFGYQHLPLKWSFVLTLNRASALPGKGGGQNILLLYKSRFNIRKDRFRVKTKRECLFWLSILPLPA